MSNNFYKALEMIQTMDDKIKNLNKDMEPYKIEMENIKKKRDVLQNKVVTYIKNNNMKKKIDYNGAFFELSETKTTEGITKKYLEKKFLELYNGDKKKADFALKFIWDGREDTIKENLKIKEKKSKKILI